MITIRQWDYICSRLSLLPSDLLSALKLSRIKHIHYRNNQLNRLCKRKLSLTIDQLSIEAESVYTATEISNTFSIDRTLVHYRIRTRNIPCVTKYPIVHLLQPDALSTLLMPELAALYKSNPLFQYRWQSHSSINQVCSTLEIPATDLMRLEYGRLYPTAALCTRLAKLDKSLPKDLRLWYAYYHTVGSKK